MIHETDALVLTRTALGEAPESMEDRVYVMWLIRIRAELGYKNGRWTYQGTVDRWGMPSTIKMEALCVGGCQFTPWLAATYVLDPAKLSPTSNLRLMLHPTDDQLETFFQTWLHARAILDLPITSFPEPLRGFDGFRSPTISDTHFRDWKPNGLLRTQFYEGGNVWVDFEKADNRYWGLMPGRLELTETARPTEIPTLTPEPTFTPAPSSTPTPTSTLTPIPTTARVETVVSREEVRQMPEWVLELLLGAGVSALAWVARLLVSKFGPVLGKEIMTAVLFVLAAVLEVGFGGLALPSGGVAEFIEWLVMGLAEAMAAAFVLYNVLLKRVFDAIGKRSPALAIPETS
jgi:hypothetical protein